MTASQEQCSADIDRDPLIGLVASLAAAISLLEQTPKAKKAAPSDTMFEMMLSDYRRALEAGREFVIKHPIGVAQRSGMTLADLITMIDMVENHTDAIDLADRIWPLIAAQPPAAPVEADDITEALNARQAEINESMARPGSSAGNGDETGWLIEKDDPPVYCILSDDYDEHWTSDANKALRFARREDAQAYSDHIGWTSPPVRVVEHAWPALEPMPRGGLKVDWWEQSVLYRRRLRALMKLVEKEGYSVSSDGRNGTPMALVRTRDEPQAVPDSAPVKLLEDIERIASYPLSGTSLQQKAQRFDLIRDKARAALALTRPHRVSESAPDASTPVQRPRG